ncbi:helix-turn-helix transcriptional regulator [Streptomyces sp. NPDC056290]|uniref:helix-turn-helix transcriptional regulator n=1 Tax=Streptomyces sp. NPDC056290 TaxID=3345771 RepID=UPI0035D86C47
MTGGHRWARRRPYWRVGRCSVGDGLGILLRRLREEADLTQEQVAERSGVSVHTIRPLESGSSPNRTWARARSRACSRDRPRPPLRT